MKLPDGSTRPDWFGPPPKLPDGTPVTVVSGRSGAYTYALPNGKTFTAPATYQPYALALAAEVQGAIPPGTMSPSPITRF